MSRIYPYREGFKQGDISLNWEFKDSPAKKRKNRKPKMKKTKKRNIK